jgi:hypothetical protein
MVAYECCVSTKSKVEKEEVPSLLPLQIISPLKRYKM